MHAFDRLLWRRCLGLACLLALMVAGVAAATDEPGSTLGARLSRLAAFLPAVGVIAQALVLAQCRERGELGALAALGVSPPRQVLGAIAAGLTLGGAAVALVLLPHSDVRSLFPVVNGGSSFVAVGDALRDPVSGIVFSPDGSLAFGAATEPALSASAPGRGAALGFVAPLACATAFWGAAPLRALPRLGAAAVCFVLSVVVLHAVAAGRLSPALLWVGAAPLAAQAILAFRRARV